MVAVCLGCGATPQTDETGKTQAPASSDTSKSSVVTVATFDAVNLFQYIEGLAIDHAGNVYVGIYYYGQIEKITPSGVVTIFASLPVGTLGGGIVGLAVDDADDVYACLSSYDTNQGIWKISHDGSSMKQIAAIDPAGFPNGMAFDAEGNIFVTDSTLGRVWRISRCTGSLEVFAQGPLFEPNNPLGDRVGSYGANGIQIDDDALWVTNTDKGAIVRIDLLSFRHEPELWLQSDNLIGADGNAFDEDHNQYVALDANGNPPPAVANTIVRITPRKVIQTLFTPSEGLDAPATVAFGQAPGQRRQFFWTNSGFAFNEPTVMRSDVGEEGVRLPITGF